MSQKLQINSTGFYSKSMTRFLYKKYKFLEIYDFALRNLIKKITEMRICICIKRYVESGNSRKRKRVISWNCKIPREFKYSSRRAEKIFPIASIYLKILYNINQKKDMTRILTTKQSQLNKINCSCESCRVQFLRQSVIYTRTDVIYYAL